MSVHSRVGNARITPMDGLSVPDMPSPRSLSPLVTTTTQPAQADCFKNTVNPSLGVPSPSQNPRFWRSKGRSMLRFGPFRPSRHGFSTVGLISLLSQICANLKLGILRALALILS